MTDTLLDKSSGIADVDADTKKAVVVAVYDDTPPTNTTGDVRPLRIDAEGRLMVNAAGGGGAAASDTELPDAVAPTDAEANTAAPAVNARGMGWTGSAWARLQALTSAPGAGAVGLVVRSVGAATETTLAALKAVADNMLTRLNLLATEATADATRVAAASIDTKTPPLDAGAVPVRAQGTTTVSGSVVGDTELPAAAVPSDADANASIPALLTRLQVWTGTVWTRARVGDLGGLLIESADQSAAEDNANAVLAVAPAPFPALTFTNGNPTVCERYANRGTLATQLVKSSAGKVYSLSCTNLNGAARYVQLHNTAAALVGGEVPQFSKLVPGSGAQLLLGPEWFTQFGEGFDVGITFAFSTTENTYSAGAAADQSTEIRWI